MFNRTSGACNAPEAFCLTTLYIMRSDGTHVRRVTQRHATTTSRRQHFEDRWAQFTPSGTHLVFERGDDSRHLSGGAGLVPHAIFTVWVDGTGLRRITPWRLDAAQPDWAPNGRWILFRSHENDNVQNNLFLVHPDGTDLHRITHTFGGKHQWLSCSFSPDGRFITVAPRPGTRQGREPGRVRHERGRHRPARYHQLVHLGQRGRLGNRAGVEADSSRWRHAAALRMARLPRLRPNRAILWPHRLPPAAPPSPPVGRWEQGPKLCSQPE